MILRRILPLLLSVTLAACQALGPPAPTPRPRPETPERPPPETPVPEEEQPVPPPAPPPKQFRLSAASSALVTQARRQSEDGEPALAIATLERAQRIEPDNPLLWIELARIHLGQGNAAQAEAMGRKALALATGDPNAQSAAWRVIADALRSRGRNQEASEAEQRAASLVVH